MNCAQMKQSVRGKVEYMCLLLDLHMCTCSITHACFFLKRGLIFASDVPCRTQQILGFCVKQKSRKEIDLVIVTILTRSFLNSITYSPVRKRSKMDGSSIRETLELVMAGFPQESARTIVDHDGGTREERIVGFNKRVELQQKMSEMKWMAPVTMNFDQKSIA